MAKHVKRRSRAHGQSTSLAIELAQTRAALETLAQMIVGGRLSSDALLSVVRSSSGAESIGDAMRERLIESALAITAVEAAHPSVWERADWRETCDAVAVELSRAGTHTAAIRQLLAAAAPSRPARLR